MISKPCYGSGQHRGADHAVSLRRAARQCFGSVKPARRRDKVVFNCPLAKVLWDIASGLTTVAQTVRPKSMAKDVQRTVQSAEVFVKGRLIETSADWTVRCTSLRLHSTGEAPNSRKADRKPMNID